MLLAIRNGPPHSSTWLELAWNARTTWRPESSDYPAIATRISKCFLCWRSWYPKLSTCRSQSHEDGTMNQHAVATRSSNHGVRGWTRSELGYISRVTFGSQRVTLLLRSTGSGLAALGHTSPKPQDCSWRKATLFNNSSVMSLRVIFVSPVKGPQMVE
jgi:hypothetical protein